MRENEEISFVFHVFAKNVGKLSRFKLINWQHESQDKSLRKVTFKNAYGFQCSTTSVFTAHITFNAHQHCLVLEFAQNM